MATNIAPISSGSGCSQLEKASPSPPAGTLPAAIAPTTAPMKNGVSTEERAKVAPAAALPGEALDRLAEGEARAAQDDPHGGQGERHVEGASSPR